MENTNQARRNPRVLKWSLIIGIMIVLNLFFNYALSVVYHAPQYEKFCTTAQVQEAITTANRCVEIGGQWTPNVNYAPKANDTVAGYCDAEYTCRGKFTEANTTYERNIFVSLVVLGVLSLVLSIFMIGRAPVIATSLSLGGVLSFVIASFRYWGSAGDIIRLAILGLALVGLMWIGYKKFRE